MILKNIFKNFRFSFNFNKRFLYSELQNTSSLKNQLTGITTIYAPSKDNIYIDLISGNLPIYLDSTILSYKERLIKENPKIDSNVIDIKFYNEQMEEYALSSPLYLIIFQNFYLKFDNKLFLVVVNNNSFFEKKNQDETKDEFFNLKNLINSHVTDFVEKEVLTDFLQNIISEINNTDQKNLNSDHVKSIIFNAINAKSVKSRKELEIIDERIKLFQERIDELQEKKNIFIEKIKKKSKKRLNWIMTAMVTQVALLQYGTYVAFSWDIMEPLTCLCGIMDLIIAYVFFLKNSKEYSFPELQSNYVNIKENKFIHKNDNLMDHVKIEEMKILVNKLRNERIFYTNDLNYILEELMKKKEISEKETD